MLITQPYDHPELIPAGKIQTITLTMEAYPDKRQRRILVWTPEDYDGVKRLPVIYMHDGQGVFACGDGRNKLEMDRAVMALAGEGLSAIVVAIDTAETRGTELTPPYPRRQAGADVNGHRLPLIEDASTTPLYGEFIVKQVKPLIDAEFATLPDAAHTTIGGISAGGSASYYLFLRYPEVFGRAIVCSPGFPMFRPNALLEELDGYDFVRLADHRIAFFNGDQGIDVTSVDDVLAVYRKFKAKGMDRRQAMFLFDSRQTHNEAAWAKYMPEILRFLMKEDNSEAGF